MSDTMQEPRTDGWWWAETKFHGRIVLMITETDKGGIDITYPSGSTASLDWIRQWVVDGTFRWLGPVEPPAEPYRPVSPLERAVAGLVRLHEAMRADPTGGDGSLCDAIRDELDGPMGALGAADRLRAQRVSEALYDDDPDGYGRPRPVPYDEVVEALRVALKYTDGEINDLALNARAAHYGIQQDSERNPRRQQAIDRFDAAKAELDGAEGVLARIDAGCARPGQPAPHAEPAPPVHPHALALPEPTP